MPSNPGGAVYGTIAIAAMLAAESARSETYLETVGAALITLVLYWFAHSYADLASERVRTGEPLTLAGIGRMMGHEFAILVGAVGPLLTILICWAAGADLYTAVKAAVWTSAAIITVTELAIGIHNELRGWELFTQTMVGAALGLLLIALRVVLH